MIILTNKYTLQINGANSPDFLQGQLTCNITTIKPQQWSFFGYCNYQGKVITTGYLFCHSFDSWFIIIDQSLAGELLKKLQPVAALSQVTITPSSLVATTTIEKNPLQIKLPGSLQHLTLAAKNIVKHDANLEQDFYTAELTATIPIITAATSKKFTPHALNLAAVILDQPAQSFNKGCYVGQEIVSRIYHKGQNKKDFILANTEKVERIITPQTIFNATNQPVGYIIQIASKANLVGCVLPKAHSPNCHWQDNNQTIDLNWKLAN